MREALRRLEGDGHVVRDRSGGVRPNAPRVSVDARALRRAHRARGPGGAHRRPGAARRRCTRSGWSCAPSTTTRPDFVHADEAFHEAHRARDRQPATERYLRDINERIRVIRIHDFTTPDRIEATIEEHLEILERSGRASRRGRGAHARAHRARRRSGGAPRGRAARAHVRGGAPVSSVATNAFAAARSGWPRRSSTRPSGGRHTTSSGRPPRRCPRSAGCRAPARSPAPRAPSTPAPPRGARRGGAARGSRATSGRRSSRSTPSRAGRGARP